MTLLMLAFVKSSLSGAAALLPTVASHDLQHKRPLVTGENKIKQNITERNPSKHIRAEEDIYHGNTKQNAIFISN